MRERDLPALVAELLGTFLFFFVGAGSAVVGGGLLEVALAHGLVLAVLVSAFGALSGAHFNPAVTFGVWIAGHIAGARALAYVAAQLIGGLGAGLALRLLLPAEAVSATALGTPALGAGIGPPAGIGIELVLTLVLLFAVLGTAVDRRAPRLGGLAIGLAVAADILVGGPLTGAAMNPARWFGPAVASGTFADWYVWWIGPLAGAAVAGAIYRFVLAGKGEPEVAPATPEGL